MEAYYVWQTFTFFGSNSIRGKSWYNEAVRDKQWDSNESDKIFWMSKLFYQCWMVGCSHEWFWIMSNRWSKFVVVKKKRNQLKTGEKKKSAEEKGVDSYQVETLPLFKQFTAVDAPFNQSESLLRRQGSDLSPVSQLRNTVNCVLWNHVQIWLLIQSNKSCPKRLLCLCGHRACAL